MTITNNYIITVWIIGFYFAMILQTYSQSNATLVSYYDDNGRTPLINAIITKDIENVEYLIENKELIDLAERDGLQGTPLMYAASMGWEQICKALLQKGASIDQVDINNDHALNWAAFGGQASVIELLLKENASVQHSSKHGTAVEVVERLWHADSVIEPFYNTSIARQLSDSERKLLKAQNANDIKNVSRWLKQGLSADQKDALGRPLILLASKKGQLEMVRTLITLGANVDEMNRVGQSALAWAAKNGNTEVVELLLNSGANPNQTDTKYALSPLIGAAVGGKPIIGQKLLVNGAEITHRDVINNAEALHWAILYGNEDFAKILVKYGADPYDKALEQNQYTAVDLARNYQLEELSN
ncbi:MAG: hypothetical protein HKM28_05580 [Flavobacteriaceae bacterium]|nr:hypothetical protein [Flavobacteriaceae bacterium]